MLRYLLGYLHKQLKKSGAAKKNKMIDAIMVGLHCYLALFERCVKFLNKNAYI
jgi:solute carrier family 44 protein 1 (choline transporter-like protein)/choline transporter-like protein 2/4/5